MEPQPNITVLKEMIEKKYKNEKYIALKNITQRKFQAMQMELFIDSKLPSVIPWFKQFCYYQSLYQILM